MAAVAAMLTRLDGITIGTSSSSTNKSASSLLSCLSHVDALQRSLQSTRIHRSSIIGRVAHSWHALPGVLLAMVANYLPDGDSMIPSTICRSWQLICTATSMSGSGDAGSGGWSRIRGRATAYNNIRRGRFARRSCGAQENESFAASVQEPTPLYSDGNVRCAIRSDGRIVVLTHRFQFLVIDASWLDLFDMQRCHHPLCVASLIEFAKTRAALSSLSSSSIMATSINDICMTSPIYYMPLHPLHEMEHDETEWIVAMTTLDDASDRYASLAASPSSSSLIKRFAPPRRARIEDAECERLTVDEWMERRNDMQASVEPDGDPRNAMAAETTKLWLLTDDIVVTCSRYWTTVWRLSTGECLNHWKMDYDTHGVQRLDDSEGDDGELSPAWLHPSDHMVDTRRWWLWQFGDKNQLTYIWDLRDGTVITPSLNKWRVRADVNRSFGFVSNEDDIYDNNVTMIGASLASDIHAMYHWHHHDIIIVVSRSGIWLYDMTYVTCSKSLQQVTPYLLGWTLPFEYEEVFFYVDISTSGNMVAVTWRCERTTNQVRVWDLTAFITTRNTITTADDYHTNITTTTTTSGTNDGIWQSWAPSRCRYRSCPLGVTSSLASLFPYAPVASYSTEPHHCIAVDSNGHHLFTINTDSHYVPISCYDLRSGTRLWSCSGVTAAILNQREGSQTFVCVPRMLWWDDVRHRLIISCAIGITILEFGSLSSMTRLPSISLQGIKAATESGYSELIFHWLNNNNNNSNNGLSLIYYRQILLSSLQWRQGNASYGRQYDRECASLFAARVIEPIDYGLMVEPTAALVASSIEAKCSVHATVMAASRAAAASSSSSSSLSSLSYKRSIASQLDGIATLEAMRYHREYDMDMEGYVISSSAAVAAKAAAVKPSSASSSSSSSSLYVSLIPSWHDGWFYGKNVEGWQQIPYNINQPRLWQLSCSTYNDTLIERHEDELMWSIPSPQLTIINCLADSLTNGNWSHLFDLLDISPSVALQHCRTNVQIADRLLRMGADPSLLFRRAPRQSKYHAFNDAHQEAMYLNTSAIHRAASKGRVALLSLLLSYCNTSSSNGDGTSHVVNTGVMLSNGHSTRYSRERDHRGDPVHFHQHERLPIPCMDYRPWHQTGDGIAIGSFWSHAACMTRTATDMGVSYNYGTPIIPTATVPTAPSPAIITPVSHAPYYTTVTYPAGMKRNAVDAAINANGDVNDARSRQDFSLFNGWRHRSSPGAPYHRGITSVMLLMDHDGDPFAVQANDWCAPAIALDGHQTASEARDRPFDDEYAQDMPSYTKIPPIPRGYTPLHMVALCKRPRAAIRCARLLIEHGGDMNKMTSTDVWWSGAADTPISFAARRGHTALVKFFNEHPHHIKPINATTTANATATNNTTNTNMMTSSTNMIPSLSSTSHISCVSSSSSSISLVALNPLFEAIRTQRISAIQYFVERGDYMYGHQVESALHHCVLCGDLYTAKYIVVHYPHLVHHRDNAGRTPLHYAAYAYGQGRGERGNSERNAVRQWLINMGADPHARTYDGDTPFLLAARNGEQSIWYLPPENGARLRDGKVVTLSQQDTVREMRDTMTMRNNHGRDALSYMINPWTHKMASNLFGNYFSYVERDAMLKQIPISQRLHILARYDAHIDVAVTLATSHITAILSRIALSSSTSSGEQTKITQRRVIKALDTLSVTSLHFVATGDTTNIATPIADDPLVTDSSSSSSSVCHGRTPYTYAHMYDRIQHMYHHWCNDDTWNLDRYLDHGFPRDDISKPYTKLKDKLTVRIQTSIKERERLAAMTSEQIEAERIATLKKEQEKQNAFKVTRSDVMATHAANAAALGTSLVITDRNILFDGMRPLVQPPAGSAAAMRLKEAQAEVKRLTATQPIVPPSPPVINVLAVSPPRISSSDDPVPVWKAQLIAARQRKMVESKQSSSLSSPALGSYASIESMIHSATLCDPATIIGITTAYRSFHSVTHRSPPLVWQRDTTDAQRISDQHARLIREQTHKGMLLNNAQGGRANEHHRLNQERYEKMLLSGTPSPRDDAVVVSSSLSSSGASLSVSSAVSSSSLPSPIRSSSNTKRSSPTITIAIQRCVRRTISTILLPWLLTHSRMQLHQSHPYVWRTVQPANGVTDGDYYSNDGAYVADDWSCLPPYMSYPFVWTDHPLVIAQQFSADRPRTEMWNATTMIAIDQPSEQQVYATMRSQQYDAIITPATDTATTRRDTSSSSSSIVNETKTGVSSLSSSLLLSIPTAATTTSGTGRVIHSARVTNARARPWHDMMNMTGIRLPNRARGWSFNWPLYRQSSTMSDSPSSFKKHAGHVQRALSGQCDLHVSQWSDECIAMACVLTPIISSIIIRLIGERLQGGTIDITAADALEMQINSATDVTTATNDARDADRLSQLSLISHVECIALIVIIRDHLTTFLA